MDWVFIENLKWYLSFSSAFYWSKTDKSTFWLLLNFLYLSITTKINSHPHKFILSTQYSITFLVDNFSTIFLILSLGNPHGLEGRQWWQDWSTDPNQELSFLRSKHLHLHYRWSQSSHFLAQSLRKTWEHRCTTTQDNVAVQVFSEINIALEDWLVSEFMQTLHIFSEQHWLEKGFWASESLATDRDSLSIWEFINFIFLISL